MRRETFGRETFRSPLPAPWSPLTSPVSRLTSHVSRPPTLSSPMLPLTLDDFTSARNRIKHRIHCTPIHTSTLLGREIGTELHLKCENFQKTGSFKVRGALNKLTQLDESSRAR